VDTLRLKENVRLQMQRSLPLGQESPEILRTGKDMHSHDHHPIASRNSGPMSDSPGQLPSSDQGNAGSSSSIVLIRRDPSSGKQWNVATVTDPPVIEITSSSYDRDVISPSPKQSGAPLYIEMQNPGYSKYTSGPDQNCLPSNGTNPPRFKRRMWLEGSLFGRSSGHRKSLSAEAACAGELRGRVDPDQPSSYLTQPYLALSQKRISYASGTDQRRSATKGYTFMSPWNGRCEFSVSSLGSSLKVGHIPAQTGHTKLKES